MRRAPGLPVQYPSAHEKISVGALQAVHDGLVYIADTGKKVHCLDARDGSTVWTHDARGEFWASPYVADGRVYIGSRRGDFWTLAAGREKKVLAEVDLEDPISATAVAANGVLYVATMTRLFAISQPRSEDPAHQ